MTQRLDKPCEGEKREFRPKNETHAKGGMVPCAFGLPRLGLLNENVTLVPVVGTDGPLYAFAVDRAKRRAPRIAVGSAI